MKNGFTLIELLAVIVILAIIALIATPIVLDIIDDTKKESLELSAQNYINAVELSISNKILNDSTLDLNGVYEIINSGKQIKKDEIILDIPINGDLLKEGYIVIDKSKVIKLSGVKLDNWNVKVNNGIVKLTKEEEKTSTLVTGQQFNEKIKTLANGVSTKFSVEDNKIESIEFYSEGIFPTGYTKEKLEELPNIDVSLNGDIIAYNDNGKIYIYSDNIISFNANASYMFNKFSFLKEVKFTIISTNKVTNMISMFANCKNLKYLDGSKIDTSMVTSFSYMFTYCSNLTTLDVSGWDTTNAQSFYYMFAGCSSLTYLDVSKWNTSNVNNMDIMFAGCGKLENLDVSKWNTAKVQTMYKLFNGCGNLTNLDVSNWDTSEVSNMSYLFFGCRGLAILDLSKWNTDKVTNMDYMFTTTSKLKPIFVPSSFGISATKNNMFNGSKTSNEEQLCEPNSTEEWCTVDESE